jgi:hypothetical protein
MNITEIGFAVEIEFTKIMTLLIMMENYEL